MDIINSMFNYSFWADEGYIAAIALQFFVGKISLFTAWSIPGITYQRLQIVSVSLFFKLFGISEFAARLPSILFFFFGVIVILFLAKKLSNTYGGLVASFLYGLSHLNLAYATQAKPYSAIEFIALSVVFVLTCLKNEKKLNRIFLYHTLLILLLTFATLLHSIGVLLWSMYFALIIITLTRSRIVSIKYVRYAFVAFFVTSVGAVGYIFVWPFFLSLLKGAAILPYNHMYQFVKLFFYKYALITACALCGYSWIFKKHKALSIIVFAYACLVFFMANFRIYIFNIRYVLSLFGILFLYFGIFWAKVGERYQFKIGGKAIIPLTVIVLLYATGYKIVRWPQAYYNPNIDKYGDVQIANYKDFYGELKQKFPDYKNMYVVNDTFDVEYWYFGRYSNAYFMKFTEKPYKHHTADAMIYGTLADFKKIMEQQPQGLLIVEDWQSFLPDDIKEYAKKNLKLEFRVESLKEAPDDPWPLALYSWGL